MSTDDPKLYEVDPLEYIAARVFAATPPHVTNEVATLAMMASGFLADEALPEAWRRTFVQTLADACRTGSGRPRINAIGLLTSIADSCGLVRETLVELQADGTWEVCRTEFAQHVASLPAPPEDALERMMWTFTRRTASLYLPPRMSGEQIFTLVGPDESRRRERADDFTRKALAAGGRGAHREAATCWAEVARLLPDNRNARLSRALCLIHAGDGDEAIGLLDVLCHEEPDNPAYHAARGTALLVTDRDDEALVAMDRALELDPGRASALLNKARVLAGRGRHLEAEELLRTGARAGTWKLPPEQVDDAARALAGHAAEALAGRRFGSLAHVAAAGCEVQPQVTEWWLMRALAASELGCPAEAEEYLARAGQGRPDVETALMRADLALRAGDLATAAACADLVLAREPASAAALWIRAHAACGAGELDTAVGLYRRYLALRPHDGRTWNDLGITLQQTGDRDDALVCLRRAVELSPDEGLHWANLALAALNAAEDGADGSLIRDCLVRARQLAPTAPTTLLAVAAFHLATGDVGEAERTAAQLLSRSPDHAQAQAIMAACRDLRASQPHSGDFPEGGG
ncbi:tetratricopeptide repeat protein [Streptomyces sp. NPDC053069]|uniref:tetratricopeptide repeat protein n=1 Tax=Streptomyces sp. NPDC053069 TaxID=3365695 RepID=UPI0037CD49B4